MDPQIALSAELFNVSTALVKRALQGLDPEDLLATPGEDSNPAIAILAHLAHTRCSLLRHLGSDAELPWQARFGRGGSVDSPAAYPSKDEFLAVWNQATGELATRLETITADELAGQAPREPPVKDKTLRGTISFLAYHEGYHVGQLAYLRKWSGKPSLVG